ncbi:hypothetical protein CA600_21175 [Paenibacillus sp. VTT E-133280]|jgi:hypothetical protein|uniref:hypothetical protein n=1 Tax=Paenibacillus sp. VTT E-133280 TaxID=1986222 RepID=UPI000BA12E3F|nr:hypothetical protein [Paenibacillus sp. VTT E-133280]OZQ62778.1 hypothetical protein CA600_21175 [Paenibacillus sp. VTT E-133280]
MSINRINFFYSDRPYPTLEPVAGQIADFLYRYQGQLPNFIDFMRISSSWRKNDYKNKLQSWASRKRGRKRVAATDIEMLINSAENFFNVCETDEEIKKIRGLIPEKLVEKVLNNRYMGKACKMGFGKGVEIDGEEIKYICLAAYRGEEDSDENRQSVDAGVWDGNRGEFIEVKFSPGAFHSKDINYLRLLKEKLDDAELLHTVYLISLGDKNLTRKKLESIDKWNDSEFVIIGSDELFQLEDAETRPAS